MYPEDRVLITYLPDPDDFEIMKREGWYRIPERHAPKGLHAEYFAFYFGQRFGGQKWAIHYYAEQRGFELVKRIDLFPDEDQHPRAQDYYFKVALGPLQELKRPIVSMRWRRITFMHRTWDRFQDAREINDLFIVGGEYVDRAFAALRDRGIPVDKNYKAKEAGDLYAAPLSIQCRDGEVDITLEEIEGLGTEIEGFIGEIEARIEDQGGLAK